MLSDEKILVTGPAGRIGRGLTEALARDNEVWGLGRFSDPAQRDELRALGVTAHPADLSSCDFGELPTDFTYLVHTTASFESSTFDEAIRINAEATGFLLEHCRKAKAALIMSSPSVYKPSEDPWHAFREGDPIGDSAETVSAPYAVSKIGSEIVARYCARSLGLPVVIARMGAADNHRGGLPAVHADRISAGLQISARWNPLPYSVIHCDDIVDQCESMLDAASTPARTVNWCGDEPVSVQEWAGHLSDLLGKPADIEYPEPVHGMSKGLVGDTTARRSITGPCNVSWKDGFRRMVDVLHPKTENCYA